jgi:TatD DNase family protein
LYFDSHAHLDDRKFNDDRDKLIQKAKTEGIGLIVNPGDDISSSKKAISLADKYDFIYAAVGVHPHNAKEVREDTYRQLEQLANHPKVVAIGEIGLDYHYNHSPQDIQKQVFQGQIQLAGSLKLPIIVHDREAHGDTFEILQSYFSKDSGGVLHSYSGSVEMAYRIIDLGMYLSISGPVTFKNAKKTVEVVREIPLEHLLIETDSPYLTPVPFRGKKNHPAMVKYVAEKIAEIKGISVEEVAEKTTENAKRLFGIV